MVRRVVLVCLPRSTTLRILAQNAPTIIVGITAAKLPTYGSSTHSGVTTRSTPPHFLRTSPKSGHTRPVLAHSRYMATVLYLTDRRVLPSAPTAKTAHRKPLPQRIQRPPLYQEWLGLRRRRRRRRPSRDRSRVLSSLLIARRSRTLKDSRADIQRFKGLAPFNHLRVRLDLSDGPVSPRRSQSSGDAALALDGSNPRTCNPSMLDALESATYA